MTRGSIRTASQLGGFVIALVLAGLVSATALADAPHQPPFIAQAAAELAHPNDQGPDPFLSTCQQAAPAAPTTNVDVIAGDANNIGAGRNHGCLAPQNEPAVAVDPLDPNILVAGANDYRDCCVFDGVQHRNDGGGYAYVSRDGGRTWLSVRLPGATRLSGARGVLAGIDSAGDPSVAFGPDGTVYYANIAFSRTGSDSAVLLSVSHDGGLTWGRPRIVRYDKTPLFFNDKEWVTVGGDGRVYVTWTRFASDPFTNTLTSAYIVARSSSDQGAHWSRLSIVSPRHLYSQGSQPQVAPDGTIEVAYEAASPLANYLQDAIVVARSSDHGKTWQEQEVARVWDDWNCYPIDWTSGRQVLSGQEFRINSFPSFSVDPATGASVLAWADDQGAGNCGRPPALYPTLELFTGTTSNQVKVVTSQDGRHFSAPTVITTGADTAMPAAAIRNGVAVVSYYVRNPLDSVACSPDGVTLGFPACVDYAYRSSRDGYATERLLTDAPSNPFVEFGGQFLGDYTSIAIGSDGVAHAVWTDSRGSFAPNQDIYAANFTPAG